MTRCLRVDSNYFPIDPNGNLTTKIDGTGTWTYEWDAENQLVSVAQDGVRWQTYAYDPLGRRVEIRHSRVPDAFPTTMVYDGDDILRTSSGNPFSWTTSTAYIHGPGVDEPLALQDQLGALTYYHADGLGSVVASTNASGALASTTRYDAWGNIEAGYPSVYAFTGREYDAITGLYYYRARYYDPVAGRFLSEDTVPDPAKGSRFQYADDDPVNLMDSSGKVATARRRKKPSPTEGTIVCDGKGGIDLHLPGAPGYPDCLVDCWTRHEDSHRRDALASNRRVCVGVPAGIAVEFLSPGDRQRQRSEKKACEIHLQCLRDYQEAPCRSSDCNDATLQLTITLVEADCAKKIQ